MKLIYLVSKSGPEWNEPIAAFATKAGADKFADEVNVLLRASDNSSLRNTIDSMSTAMVTAITYEE